MAVEKLEYLAEEIHKLSANEKGLLFSLFFSKEKEKMKGDRKQFKDSIKFDKEITDEDIKSCLYNPNLDDLLK